MGAERIDGGVESADSGKVEESAYGIKNKAWRLSAQQACPCLLKLLSDDVVGSRVSEKDGLRIRRQVVDLNDESCRKQDCHDKGSEDFQGAFALGLRFERNSSQSKARRSLTWPSPRAHAEGVLLRRL